MSFKLIAIRPLEGCNEKFLKNLEENRIYQFYNDYEFILDEKQEKVIEIIHTQTVSENLFGNNINISAIVGKNGSGKSSLVELLYAFIYYLSRYKDFGGFIKDESIAYDVDLDPFEKDRYIKELECFKKLNLEIFYDDGDIRKVKLNYDLFSKKRYRDNKFTSKNFITSQDYNKNDCIDKEFVNRFFYSIVLNYSLYGLNTNDMGLYLKTLFHKNDGYQTPIVLNPMRTEGDIKINVENYLSKARLLPIILLPIENNPLRELAKDKVAEKIKIEIRKSKFNYDDDKLDKNFTERYKNLLPEIYKAFFNTDKDNRTKENFAIIEDSVLQQHTIEYILRKIDTIANRYPIYRKVYKKDFKLYNSDERKRFFESLASDYSHITFKLRQSINFLKYNNVINDENLNSFIKLNLLTDQINKVLTPNVIFSPENEPPGIPKTKEVDKISNIMNLIPPSFIDIDIEFKNNQGTLNNLSSGEKQKIFTLNSIAYHLINLDSIRNNTGLIKYSKINIIFDEIELYFHPELQRNIIKDILDLVEKTGINDANQLNFIFITHSPFILSDIPSQNIMYLEVEKELDINGSEKLVSIQKQRNKTFGANIHDLLADSFFMKDGYMGEFAKEKIKNVIKILNSDKKTKISEPEKKDLKLFIDQIGEPILRNTLVEMYYSKFETDLDNEIKRLTKLQNKKIK